MKTLLDESSRNQLSHDILAVLNNIRYYGLKVSATVKKCPIFGADDVVDGTEAILSTKSL